MVRRRTKKTLVIDFGREMTRVNTVTAVGVFKCTLNIKRDPVNRLRVACIDGISDQGMATLLLYFRLEF